MEKRVEYGWLLDFYGALLTEHRLRVMRMYLEEDLSLQEIADAMGITRQGVHDAEAAGGLRGQAGTSEPVQAADRGGRRVPDGAGQGHFRRGRAGARSRARSASPH